MRRLCCLATVVVLSATCGGAAVAAGHQLPHGKLTATEYVSLGKMIASVKAAAQRKPIVWSRMRAACLTGQVSTPLLVSVRSACQLDARFLQLLLSIPSALAECIQTKSHRLQCEVSLYSALARDDRASYTADAAVRTAASKRGFSGTCLAVISNPERVLRLEKQLSDATQALAQDIRATLKASEGHPIRGFTRAKAERDAAAFQRDFDALERAPSPSDIRDCPHAPTSVIVALRLRATG